MVKPPVTLLLGPDRVPMEFRHVPAGSFLMGQRGELDREEPVHAVEVGEFYLGTYPVTQRQFEAWTKSPEYAAWLEKEGKALKEVRHKNRFSGNPEHPADDMTWHAAVAFGRWIRDHAADLPSGFTPRLPTEAEWEYACRWRPDPCHPTQACTPCSCARTEYYNGDGEAALSEVGWYDANSGETSHEVTEKPESHPLGLCCLHGNVDEWCADVYDDQSYRKRIDRWQAQAWTLELAGGGASKYPGRVVRGGSWYDSAWACRSAIRIERLPGGSNWDRGFRVALVPESGGGQQQGSGATASQQRKAPGDGGRESERSGEGRPESEGAAMDLSVYRLPPAPPAPR